MSKLDYSLLPDGNYELQEKHIEDISDRMTSIFLNKNEVWSKAGLDRQKLKPFFVNKVTQHIELQNKRRAQLGKRIILNTIWIQKGQLAGCFLNYDIDDYKLHLNKHEKEEIPLFQMLEEVGAKLLKNINLDVFESGKSIYANFGFNEVHTTKEDLTKSQQVVDHYLPYKYQGYRFILFRASNLRLWPMYETAGAQMKAKQTLKFGKREFTIYFVSMDMESPKFVQVENQVKEHWAKKGIQRAKL